MRKVWYVYILRCADDTLYTGITNFLKRRVETHNRQKGARYTRSRTPVKLVYSEKQPSCGAALKREAYIKTFSPKRKRELIRSRRRRKPLSKKKKSRKQRKVAT